MYHILININSHHPMNIDNEVSNRSKQCSDDAGDPSTMHKQ